MLHRTSPASIFSRDFHLENLSNRNGDGVLLEPCERASQYNLMQLFTSEKKTLDASALLEMHTSSVDMHQALLESLGFSVSSISCCTL